MPFDDLFKQIFEAPQISDQRAAILTFLVLLEKGTLRAVFEDQNRQWHVDVRIKKAILAAFSVGVLVSSEAGALSFCDKDLFPTQRFLPERGVRVVPGGSSVRRGAYIAPSVVIMPPAFVNTGAYVGAGSMIDSHALVGSCAHIGERVHLSAAAQIGGVLEPIHAVPVIIEDDVFIGGNVGIYEGTLVRKKAVIGAGVILTQSTPVYDLPHKRILRATQEKPLEIPQGAVVVPGARCIPSEFGKEHGLSIATPLIIKYRDEKTDQKAQLESLLRL